MFIFMYRFILALLVIYPFGFAVAQPGVLNLPAPAAKSSATSGHPTGSLDDVVALYGSPRNAALAVFRLGYDAARKHETSKAITLFLEAVNRDSNSVKALYNLGLECAVDERWRDASQFYATLSQRVDLDPQMKKLVDEETDRVSAILELEAMPGGRHRRQFIGEFQPLFSEKDPYKAMARLQSLAKKYPAEWETSALLGELQAQEGQYRGSVDSLTEAARLAPPALRPKIQLAVKIAQNEVNFANQVKSAEEARENEQYESAAKLFESAWNLKTARADLAMTAATSYLLADDVKGAVNDLREARDAGVPEITRRALAMLKALGTIDADAAKESASSPTAPSTSPKKSPGDSIREQIGTLQTSKMVLSAKAAPAPIEESVTIFPIKGDNKVDGGAPPGFMSTDSIFDLYLRNLQKARTQESAAPADLPTSSATGDSAASGSEPAHDRPVQLTVRRNPHTNAGPLQTLIVTTEPTGATVFVDEDVQGGADSTAGQKCTAPCRLSLSLGRHTLLTTLAGYRDDKKIIQVIHGAKPVTVALEKKGARLFVMEGLGTVRVDGKQCSTPCVMPVGEGTHEISFERQGEITVRQVIVKDREDQTIKPEKM